MSRRKRSRGGRVDFKVEDVVAVGIESNLSLTNSFAASDDIANANYDRTTNVAFACDITMPNSFNSDGLIMEAGGGGTGCGVGLINNGRTLRFITGDGANPPDLSVCALLDIDTSIFVPGSSGTLVWDFRISPGRVRAWWNGVFLGEASTSSGGNLESDLWAGTNAMTYGAVSLSIMGTLSPDIWPGSINSNLRYYSNQLISNSAAEYRPSGVFDLSSIYFTKI